PYVDAARTMGASHARIIFREILPNAVGPIVILATLGFGTAIITESALSFLGFGVLPPAPTWGGTLSYGTRFLANDPWLCFAAGMTIMLACLGFNLLGDGLRDLLDPRGFSHSGASARARP
ncbi:ABC transporter permease, partial [Rhizobiaceae sp. 2RAB30]